MASKNRKPDTEVDALLDALVKGHRPEDILNEGDLIQDSPLKLMSCGLPVAETFDVIVTLPDDQAYTRFAETMDRSGCARGTLAPRDGMAAPEPERRRRPMLTMADMGMMHAAMEPNGEGDMHHEMPAGDDEHVADMPSHRSDALPTGLAEFALPDTQQAVDQVNILGLKT